MLSVLMPVHPVSTQCISSLTVPFPPHPQTDDDDDDIGANGGGRSGLPLRGGLAHCSGCVCERGNGPVPLSCPSGSSSSQPLGRLSSLTPVISIPRPTSSKADFSNRICPVPPFDRARRGPSSKPTSNPKSSSGKTSKMVNLLGMEATRRVMTESRKRRNPHLLQSQKYATAFRLFSVLTGGGLSRAMAFGRDMTGCDGA